VLEHDERDRRERLGRGDLVRTGDEVVERDVLGVARELAGARGGGLLPEQARERAVDVQVPGRSWMQTFVRGAIAGATAPQVDRGSTPSPDSSTTVGDPDPVQINRPTVWAAGACSRARRRRTRRPRRATGPLSIASRSGEYPPATVRR